MTHSTFGDRFFNYMITIYTKIKFVERIDFSDDIIILMSINIDTTCNFMQKNIQVSYIILK